MEHERQQVGIGSTRKSVTHTDIVGYCGVQEQLEVKIEAIEVEIDGLEIQVRAICKVIAEMRGRVSQLDEDSPNVPWNPGVINVIEELTASLSKEEVMQGSLEQELAIKRSELVRLQRDLASVESIIEESEPGPAN